MSYNSVYHSDYYHQPNHYNTTIQSDYYNEEYDKHSGYDNQKSNDREDNYDNENLYNHNEFTMLDNKLDTSINTLVYGIIDMIPIQILFSPPKTPLPEKIMSDIYMLQNQLNHLISNRDHSNYYTKNTDYIDYTDTSSVSQTNRDNLIHIQKINGLLETLFKELRFSLTKKASEFDFDDTPYVHDKNIWAIEPHKYFCNNKSILFECVCQDKFHPFFSNNQFRFTPFENRRMKTYPFGECVFDAFYKDKSDKDYISKTILDAWARFSLLNVEKEQIPVLHKKCKIAIIFCRVDKQNSEWVFYTVALNGNYRYFNDSVAIFIESFFGFHCSNYTEINDIALLTATYMAIFIKNKLDLQTEEIIFTRIPEFDNDYPRIREVNNLFIEQNKKFPRVTSYYLWSHSDVLATSKLYNYVWNRKNNNAKLQNYIRCIYIPKKKLIQKPDVKIEEENPVESSNYQKHGSPRFRDHSQVLELNQIDAGIKSSSKELDRIKKEIVRVAQDYRVSFEELHEIISAANDTIAQNKNNNPSPAIHTIKRLLKEFQNEVSNLKRKRIQDVINHSLSNSQLKKLVPSKPPPVIKMNQKQIEKHLENDKQIFNFLKKASK